MITLLALFSIENLFLCIPIFILWHNISQRNSYLETLYGQLPEEEVSLKIEEFLTIFCNFSKF